MGSYINLAGTGWHGPAVALLVVNTIAMPSLAVLLWRHRQRFPLSSTPWFLTISTQVGACLYVFTLLQNMISSQPITCGLAIFLAYFELSPFLVGTLLQLFRTWFIYNLQQSRSKGQQTVFTSFSFLVGDRSLKVGWAALSLLSLVQPIVQLASHSSVLSDPVDAIKEDSVDNNSEERSCLDRTDAEWVFRLLYLFMATSARADPAYLAFSALVTSLFLWQALLKVFWGTLVVLNLLFAFLARNIKDSFNLRENWRNIIYWFAIGAPLNALAAQAGEGLDGTVKENAYAMGQLAYVVALFSYLWYACVKPLRTSSRLFAGASSRSSSGYLSENATKIEDEEPDDSAVEGRADGVGGKAKGRRRPRPGGTRSVSSTQELREALQQEETLTRFKQYLVGEFCCEPILFIISLRRLRQEDSSTQRLKAMDAIRRDFIAVGSVTEINIKDSMRSNIMATSLTDENEAVLLTALEQVEEEMHRLCLDPYNRYVKRAELSAGERRSRNRMSSSAPGGTSKILPSASG